MKGLKRIALVSAIAAAPFMAHADLQVMDEAMMGNVTGQAGVTIELDASVTIGEIQYKDVGSLFINDFRLGGKNLMEADPAVTDNRTLDNIRIDIDIAGDGSDLGSAGWGLAKINDPQVVALGADGNPNGGNTEKGVDPGIGDGDLIISLDGIDQAQGVDFGMYIGSVNLGASTVATGGGAANGGTTLLANTFLGGALGPIDIVIDGSNSNMNINAYFAVEGFIEAPFMATSFGFALHNGRGADTTIYVSQATGDVVAFAHAQVNVSPNADASKGLRVNVENFSGDMDMTSLTFGTSPAIGDVYLTDMTVKADMNIYGH